VVNYTIDDSPDQPLEFREIKPQETLTVDDQTGEVSGSFVPTEITFKDEAQRIRPVAPFLEVFAVTDHGALVPLTIELLDKLDLSPEAVSWKVRVANRKAARPELGSGVHSSQFRFFQAGTDAHDRTRTPIRGGTLVTLGWMDTGSTHFVLVSAQHPHPCQSRKQTQFRFVLHVDVHTPRRML
jgi:hypothetical protein